MVFLVFFIVSCFVLVVITSKLTADILSALEQELYPPVNSDEFWHRAGVINGITVNWQLSRQRGPPLFNVNLISKFDFFG